MAPKKAKGDWLRAKEGFATAVTGEEIIVARGEFVREGHPIAQAMPQMFEHVESRFETPDVEEMTAEPGAKRGG